MSALFGTTEIDMQLKGTPARNAMAYELVKLYGADEARSRCCGAMLKAVEAEIEAQQPKNPTGTTTETGSFAWLQA